jgi:tetratricopeptide (TPR) repeat protein
MLESFGVNIASTLFLDAVNTLRDPQTHALKGAFAYALDESLKRYEQNYNEADTKLVEESIRAIANDSQVRYILLDFALGYEQTVDWRPLEQICETHSGDFTKLKPFFLLFFEELQREVRVIAEDTDSPLFEIANLYSNERIERKVEETGSKIDETRDEVRQLRETIEATQNTTQQLQKLQMLLSDEATQRLASIRDDWNKGYLEDVQTALREFRHDDRRWQSIDSSAQAQWLRTEATFLLELRGEVITAKQLLIDAQQLAPSPQDDDYIRAHIALVEGRPVVALELLRELTGEQALRLKAIALIQLQRYQEAHQVLYSISSPININVYYTQATLALIEKDLNGAITAIERAVKIAPHSHDMQFWLGQLKYFLVLSPALQPRTFESLPDPITPIFYRTAAPKYRTQLENAARIFQDLAEHARPNMRPAAQAWYLVCLTNLTNQTEQAVQYCQRLLDESPIYEVALAWGVARDLPADYESAVKQLEQTITDGRGDHARVIALGSYYLHTEKYTQAVELFLAWKELFQDDKLEFWHEWMTRLQLAMKNFSHVEEHLKYIADEAQRLQFQVAFLIGSQDEKSLETLTQSDFSQHPLLLFSLCDYMARKNNWEWVSRYAETLVEKINTPLAFDLAIQSTFRMSQIERCLRLIRQISEHFSPDPLPWIYQNVNVKCLNEAGEYKQGYLEAKTLYSTAPNAETFVNTVAIYHQIGDLEGIAVLARDLLDKVEIDVGNTLRVVEFTSITNIGLAQELWRKVLKRDLPDEAVLFALDLANTLGTKSETQFLFERMNEMAKVPNSGIQMVSIKKAGQEIRKQVDFVREINEEYERGEIPIHMAVQQTGSSLGWYYHERLDLVEEQNVLSSQSALMVRHGGRPVFFELQHHDLKGKLSLDITAILLAEHFKILQLIESNYAPIRIPHNLVVTLVEILLQYHRKDREHIRACEEIIRLVERNKISLVDLPPVDNAHTSLVELVSQEWAQGYQWVESSDACFVNYLPILKMGDETELLELPNEISERLIDLRTIVDALYVNHHRINKREYEETIQSLGTIGQANTSKTLQEGATVLFHANTIESLAAANVLGIAAETFKIYVTDRQLKSAKAVVNGDTETHRIVAWFARLIYRVFRQITVGNYQALPLYNKNLADQEDAEALFPTYSFVTLITHCNREGDVIVIDDRFSNSVWAVDKRLILTSLDLARGLALENILTADEYYHFLTRLRRANIRYLPYTADEIVFHLVRSFDVNSLSVKSTPPLETMHRYIAACLTQTNALQLIQGEEILNSRSERGFLEITVVHLLNSIRDIWHQSGNISRSSVLSSWILDNIYIPHRNLFIEHGVLLLKNEEPETYTELFEIGRGLNSRTNWAGYSKQERFRIWLWYWIIGRSTAQDYDASQGAVQ